MKYIFIIFIWSKRKKKINGGGEGSNTLTIMFFLNTPPDHAIAGRR